MQDRRFLGLEWLLEVVGFVGVRTGRFRLWVVVMRRGFWAFGVFWGGCIWLLFLSAVGRGG